MVASETASSRPVRCTACSKPMDSPVCCASCGALNPLPLVTLNYFELFGLEPVYDIDEQALHRKYLSLTRSIHPDVVGRQSEETRRRSLSLSSELNRAYGTLRDPVARAAYLLSRTGGPETDNRSVPAELLGEVMAFRERIEEARAAGDTAALRTLRRTIAARRESVMDGISTLSRLLGNNDPETRRKLRRELDAISYWSNLLDPLPPGDEA